MRTVAVHLPDGMIRKLRDFVVKGYAGNFSESIRLCVAMGLRQLEKDPSLMEHISYGGLHGYLKSLPLQRLHRVHAMVHRLLGIKNSVVVRTGSGLKEYSSEQYTCPRCGTLMQLSGRFWWGEEWECPSCHGIFTWTKTGSSSNNENTEIPGKISHGQFSYCYRGDQREHGPWE